jgi:hypothetical protein
LSLRAQLSGQMRTGKFWKYIADWQNLEIGNSLLTARTMYAIIRLLKDKGE